MSCASCESGGKTARRGVTLEFGSTFALAALDTRRLLAGLHPWVDSMFTSEGLDQDGVMVEGAVESPATAGKHGAMDCATLAADMTTHYETYNKALDEYLGCVGKAMGDPTYGCEALVPIIQGEAEAYADAVAAYGLANCDCELYGRGCRYGGTDKGNS